MRAKIRQIWGNLQLAQKILLSYLLIFGAAAALALVGLQLSFSIYDGKLYERSLQELDFFAQKTGGVLDDIDTFTNSLAMDSDVQQQLAEMRGESVYGYQMYRLRLLIMNEMLSADDSVRSVVYIHPSGVSITVGEAVPDMDGQTLAAFLEDCTAARGGSVERSPTADYPYFVSGRRVLYRLNMSMEDLGTLYVVCDMEKIIERQKSALQTGSSNLLVYDGETVIYGSADGNAAAQQIPSGAQGYSVARYKGERYFICYLQSERSGWMFVNAFPYNEIFGSTVRVRTAMIAAFLALFALSAVLAKYLVRMMMRPLRQLGSSMKIVETGDFAAARAALPEQPAGDEIGRLTVEFGLMLDKIDALIEENYRKQLLVQENKYKMLQAQINPHFLYNTLNSLSWLNKAGRNEDAGRMAVELGQLLRAALANKTTSTVAEDVEMVKSYIAIQQYRYKKRAVFVLDVSGELDRYILPHITLQPLVENAITYGAEESLTPCTITVKVEERSESIYLCVKDTGPGMSAERLAEVRAGTAKPHGHGIGLSGIRERMGVLFGSYRFEIDSALGEGTEVKIEIPKKEDAAHGQTADS